MLSQRIDTETDLRAAVARLIRADPRFRQLLTVSGPPPLRRRDGGFAGLVSIVISQQLSTASAAAIWGRLSAAYEPFEAKKILRARATRLARLGLSAGKIKTLRAIATAIDGGALDLLGLTGLTADEAHAALVAVHGIGPWTADIYLLTCLGHADAWPAGDLALQEAARLAFTMELRPTAKEMVALAESWRPWRGVAARLLWTYYRAMKRRDGAPILPTAGKST